MLAALHSAVGAIEGDAPSGLDRVRRGVHSIKSEAAAIGVEEVRDAAESLEDSLATVDGGAIGEAAHRALIDRTLALQEAFENCVDAWQLVGEESTISGPDRREGRQPSDGNDSARGLYDLDAFEQSVLREAIERGELLYELSFRVEADEPMPDARRFLAIGNIESATAVVRVHHDPHSRDVHVLLTSQRSAQDLQSLVDVDRIADVRVSRESPDSVLAYAERGGGSPSQVVEDITLKMPNREYERLAFDVDELDYQLSRLAEVSSSREDADWVRRMAYVSSLAASIRESVRRTSTTTMDEVFAVAEAAVLDVAPDLGKSLRVTRDGDREEVPSRLAPFVRDSILHLARNAIVHGIETRGAREAAGKPQVGLIRLSARHIGDVLRVEVSDDGAGVVVGGRRLLSDSDVLSTIVRNGYTGLGAPTPHSGRGVGLEAVRHVAEDVLGGALRLRNRPGYGATFIIDVPDDTEVIDAYVVDHVATALAVPSARVLSVVPLDERFLTAGAGGDGYYMTEGRMVPLYGPGEIPVTYTVAQRETQVVLCRTDRRAVIGLPVRRVRGVEGVVRRRGSRDRGYSENLDRSLPIFSPIDVVADEPNETARPL